MLKKHLKLFFLAMSLCFTASFAFAAQSEAVKALLHQPNDPVAGNPKGKVTVVEFFDYQCSHCVTMSPVMGAIIKANPDVRVVFKDFPIRGPMSEFAARAALAANKQGKYYDFNHALMSANQPLTEEFVFETAKTSGLNVDKLKKDMESSHIKNQLEANYKLAQDLKLAGTPVFFIANSNANNINDVAFVMGEMSQSELQSAIDKASK